MHAPHHVLSRLHGQRATGCSSSLHKSNWYVTIAGGAEHAVLHLLYARFWHKVLFDLGVVSGKEPFQRLVSQGMILGEVRPSPQ